MLLIMETVFTAFIYSSEFCWVSELPHLRETVVALGPPKNTQSNVLEKKAKHEKANLECVAKIKVESEEERRRNGE